MLCLLSPGLSSRLFRQTLVGRLRCTYPGELSEISQSPLTSGLFFQLGPSGRNIAVHRALGRIREEYKDELFGLDLTMVSRRTADGEIVRTRNDDSIFSFVQDLEVHIRTLEIQTRRSTKTIKKLMFREVELEDDLREARYEHEDEVKDLLERIKNLKLYIATLEEKMDQGKTFTRMTPMAPS